MEYVIFIIETLYPISCSRIPNFSWVTQTSLRATINECVAPPQPWCLCKYLRPSPIAMAITPTDRAAIAPCFIIFCVDWLYFLPSIASDLLFLVETHKSCSSAAKNKNLRLHCRTDNLPVDFCSDSLFHGNAHWNSESQVATENVRLFLVPLWNEIRITFCGHKNAGTLVQFIFVLSSYKLRRKKFIQYELPLDWQHTQKNSHLLNHRPNIWHHKPPSFSCFVELGSQTAGLLPPSTFIKCTSYH